MRQPVAQNQKPARGTTRRPAGQKPNDTMRQPVAQNQKPLGETTAGQRPQRPAQTSSDFDISFNGPVGSHQENDCNYAGACTDQTLANGGPRPQKNVSSGNGNRSNGQNGNQSNGTNRNQPIGPKTGVATSNQCVNTWRQMKCQRKKGLGHCRNGPKMQIHCRQTCGLC